MQGSTLGAEAAEVRGMLRVAANADNPVSFALDDDAAADAAVTTSRFGFLHTGLFE